MWTLEEAFGKGECFVFGHDWYRVGNGKVKCAVCGEVRLS